MVAPSIRFDASKHHCGESSENIDCQCHSQLSVETSRSNLISELGLRRSEATNFDKRRVNQDVSITAHKFFDLSSACQTSFISRDLLAIRVVQRLCIPAPQICLALPVGHGTKQRYYWRPKDRVYYRPSRSLGTVERRTELGGSGAPAPQTALELEGVCKPSPGADAWGRIVADRNTNQIG
jgi:hypothetical protein